MPPTNQRVSVSGYLKLVWGFQGEKLHVRFQIQTSTQCIAPLTASPIDPRAPLSTSRTRIWPCHQKQARHQRDILSSIIPSLRFFGPSSSLVQSTSGRPRIPPQYGASLTCSHGGPRQSHGLKSSTLQRAWYVPRLQPPRCRWQGATPSCGP
jgi:hypothetical protein